MGLVDEKSSSITKPTSLISNNTVNLGHDNNLNANYNRLFVTLTNKPFKIKKEESYCDYCCIATRYSEYWARQLRDVRILILSIDYKQSIVIGIKVLVVCEVHYIITNQTIVSFAIDELFSFTSPK